MYNPGGFFQICFNPSKHLVRLSIHIFVLLLRKLAKSISTSGNQRTSLLKWNPTEIYSKAIVIFYDTTLTDYLGSLSKVCFGFKTVINAYLINYFILPCYNKRGDLYKTESKYCFYVVALLFQGGESFLQEKTKSGHERV